MDSGASDHMCYDYLSLFTSYKEASTEQNSLFQMVNKLKSHIYAS